MERQDADDRKDLSEKAGLCLLIKKECSQIYGDILFLCKTDKKQGGNFCIITENESIIDIN